VWVSSSTKKRVDYKGVDGRNFILEEPLPFEVREDYDIGLDFEGAYVKSPDPDLYEWVYDLDLTSMYPSIIMSLNASPETKVAKAYGFDVYDFMKKPDKEWKVWVFENKAYKTFTEAGDLKRWLEKKGYSIAANGAIYRNDIDGVIPEILKKWFDLRQSYKSKRNDAERSGSSEEAAYYDKLQHVHKILINSVYGVLGLPTFRFYDIDNAEATTLTGQATIKFTQKMGDYYYSKKLDDEQNWCIYIDTDSVFYPAVPMVEKLYPEVDTEDEDEMTEAILKVAKDTQEYINRSYDSFAKRLMNINRDHYFNIKQELIARSGLWIGKKRYAQWIINDEGHPTDELDVKGIEIIRSDYPEAFSDVLEDVIVDFLKSEPKEDIDASVLDFRSGLREVPIDRIARPTGIGDVKKWQTDEMGKRKKHCPVHFKAALGYNDLIDFYGLQDRFPKIEGGEKIRWVYLKKNNLGLSECAFKGADDPPEVMQFIKQYVDYDKLYEKELKSKLKSVYSAVGVDFPSQERRQLENFFSFG
jgi:DNA polymerase elongation subunit (family B)